MSLHRHDAYPFHSALGATQMYRTLYNFAQRQEVMYVPHLHPIFFRLKSADVFLIRENWISHPSTQCLPKSMMTISAATRTCLWKSPSTSLPSNTFLRTRHPRIPPVYRGPIWSFEGHCSDGFLSLPSRCHVGSSILPLYITPAWTLLLVQHRNEYIYASSLRWYQLLLQRDTTYV